MKKLFVTLLVALSAILCAPQASAYSQEMAQLAQAMNMEIAGIDQIKSVEYDGSNLIFNMDASAVGDDEQELLDSITDPNAVKPMMLAVLAESMDAETRAMFSQILGAFNTNMALRFPLASGKMFEVIVTPADLAQ